jgi:cytochrome c-type biogenesis protein CcmF
MLFSREAAFLLTNLLLGGAALVVLIGTLFPALTEAIEGRQAALDPSFYERTVGPLAQFLILLMGLCPWLTWRGGSVTRLLRQLVPAALAALATAILLLALGTGEAVSLIVLPLCAFVFVSILIVLVQDLAARLRRGRSAFGPALSYVARTGRRRYGAHLVHLGIVLIAVGVVGSSVYQDEVQVTLAPGETVDLGGYTLEYVGFESKELPDQQRFTAMIEATRGGQTVATLEPRQDFHWNVEQWVTEVAIHTNLRHDLYVILGGLEQDGLASFRVLINPLVAWLWIGGVLLLCGGSIAWWPSPHKIRTE